MKNLALALATTLTLAACSSGSTIAPIPEDFNFTGVYTGSFENTEGTQGGEATFNLAEAENLGVITGNAIFSTFETDTTNTCLFNNLVDAGADNGNTVTLTVGATTFQLTVSNNGNTLSGTYVTLDTVATCSNGSGAGTITLNR